MAYTTSTLTLPSDREIAMERVFNAPRELVFEVMTDPKHIPNWWGLRSSTTEVVSSDLRPGGAWRFVQRGPDGSEYGFRGEYLEVTPPSHYVYTFEFEGMPGHVVTDTVTLEDLGGKTRVLTSSLFSNKEDRDGMVASGMEAGANESWDRLEDLLATLQK